MPASLLGNFEIVTADYCDPANPLIAKTSMDKFPMTPVGFQALQDELKNLKGVVRPKVIADIAEARSHGDLSENAEYDAARERQGFVEARIRDIEAKLSRAQVIDVAKIQSDRVVFGATVTICDTENAQVQVWTLVGEDEADLKGNKLSISSPMARILVGKSVGDQVEMRTAKGVREYEITNVKFMAS
jgi:transcription elongation factor GreA